MKTKIFLAFIVVIFTALLSNFIFERLIIRDFNNYVSSIREDQLYWIMASVEGSKSQGQWDKEALSNSIHWAMMLGLDIKVINIDGYEVITSREVMESLSDTMKHRMRGLFNIYTTVGPYEEYPLYIKGKEIGTLLSRPFQKEQIKERESVFKKRTKNFLYISLLIAGGGLLLIAFLFSQYLSRPITNLKTAAERIARGDFSVKIVTKSQDEVGKLSESFNIMAESLQREEKLRRHLMSNVAHELRTPLTVMKAHVEAMDDGIIKDTNKGLENIKHEINRLVKLIKGIEDITSAEASFFTKGQEIGVNLREFLSGIVIEMLPPFKEKGLYLKMKKGENIFVTVDVEKLEIIIRNIISNSLKFTEKGGAWIDYGIQNNNFFIEVRDSGIGIPEDEIPLIFNRFYRIENLTSPPHTLEKEGEGGLGLGLAIVKELIDVIGGKVNIKSKVGKGTTFRIYFQRPISS